MSWEICHFEGITKVISLTSAVLDASVTAPMAPLPSPSFRAMDAEDSRDGGTVIIASHHKTGTAFSFSTIANLSRHPSQRRSHFIFGIIGPAGNVSADIATLFAGGGTLARGLPSVTWLENANSIPLSKAFPASTLSAAANNQGWSEGAPGVPRTRFVHLVRDPVEMVVSAYLYHLQLPKEEMWWLNAPGLFQLRPRVARALAQGSCLGSDAGWSWLEVLQCLSAAEGVVAEGWRMIKADIEPMAEVRSRLDCRTSAALTLNIDDVVHDFPASMSRLLTFLGLREEAAQGDLIETLGIVQKSLLSNTSSHITTGKYDKGALRRLVAKDTEISARLRFLRRKATCPSSSTD
jgi:hypothetical protein